ncbi:hypothetical protein DPMN_110586 [Dreissena polymorpha]|uniref:Uncharacterized protein n=1 Tax=Dreissena polymorpha TaxID=45954 RepID=A0A9D4KDG0_DREPO|nr:hypothetical protein DPMN_110586 [Dreissena polymorpha]
MYTAEIVEDLQRALRYSRHERDRRTGVTFKKDFLAPSADKTRDPLKFVIADPIVQLDLMCLVTCRRLY